MAPAGDARDPAQVPLDVLSDTIQPFPTFSEIYVAALKALHARSRADSQDGGTTTCLTSAM